MASGSAFAVDIPVTNLDENVDDFFYEERNNGTDSGRGRDNGDGNDGSDGDGDNISINLQNLDFGSGGEGLLTRGWRTVANVFGRGRGRKDGYWPGRTGDYADDIELINRNVHDLNSESSDFLGLHSGGYPARKRRRGRFARYVCAVFHSKILLHTLLLVIVSLLIALIVVVSKTRRLEAQSESESQSEYDSTPPAEEDTSSSLLTIVLAVGALHPHFISEETMPFVTGVLNSSHAVYSPYMNVNNPASMLTNLWSLTTGLQPADHGIVGDSFYDPGLSETFTPESKDPVWWNGVPIWANAERFGMSVVTFNWPGADVISNTHASPTNFESFHEADELEQQLGQLEKFLSLDSNAEYGSEPKPDLVLSYVSTLDKVVSANGLAGDALKKELARVDTFVKKLHDLLAKKGMAETTNMMLVSEGGYVPTSAERTLYLDDLVDLSDIVHVQGYPIVGLNPVIEFSTSEMVEEMKEKLNGHPLGAHFDVYAKEDIEYTLYGGSSDRISPILVVPKAGYLVATKNKVNALEGTHSYVTGYTSDEVLSRGVFLGTGPTFTRTFGNNGAVLQPFDITDVYNIICDSLGLEGDNGYALQTLEAENPLIPQWKDSKSYPGVDFTLDVLDHASFFESKFGTAANEELTIVEPETPVEDEQDAPSDSGYTYADDDTGFSDVSDAPAYDDTNTETDTEDSSSNYQDTYDNDPDNDSLTGAPSTVADNGEDTGSSSWWHYLTDAVDDAIDDVKHLLHPDDQPSETDG